MMTHNISISLIDANDLLMEMALERFDLKIHDYHCFAFKDNHAIKDVDFLMELMDFYSNPDQQSISKFEGYRFSVITDYLKKTHAYYLNRLIPKMEMSLLALTQNFTDHAVVQTLKRFFIHYRDELLEHIELEERLLFPYAQKLYDGIQTQDYSVCEFESQHDHSVEDMLLEVQCVIESKYPEVALNFAYGAFRNLVEGFRKDLHVHHLIEERVFLKKLRQMEASGY